MLQGDERKQAAIPSGWYAILVADELKKRSPLGIRRFGLDLVLWRDLIGNPHAAHDRCPHRSVKLSGGHITIEGHLACPFHGLSFDGSGTCQMVPETGSSATALRLGLYTVREQHGFIWLWYGPTTAHGDVPWFSDDIPEKASWSTVTESVRCHVTRAIENQLDYAHLAFVHKSTIGRFADPRKKPMFKDDANDGVIAFSPGDLNDKTASAIIYKFPNIWLNRISPKFGIVAAFCPKDDHETIIYLRTYQSFVTFPGLSHLIGAVNNIMNRFIFRQDARVVDTHPPGASTQTGDHELLLASDRAIRQFRRLWSSRFQPATEVRRDTPD